MQETRDRQIAPLPERLRPKTLPEFVGQKKLVGKDGVVTKLLSHAKQGGLFPSLILWGPPGSGKTTLARIIASELNRPFFEFSAVNSSVKDIEAVIGLGPKANRSKHSRQQAELLSAKQAPSGSKNTSPIIFLDEIHRFNKAQQDALLPHVEKGTITLIGATTENPSFEVISPLLSRCRVLILDQLSEKALGKIVESGATALGTRIEEKAKLFLVRSANGDARVALNVLEIASSLKASIKTSASSVLQLKSVEEALQRRQLNFDLKGEEFYNTISALHKSIRGSDPDAALYYLARMLEAGQDPLYIARRLLRAAAEDIGLADPNALLIANAAFEACDKIGMPECNVILAEAVVYLAKAPKSNKLYLAYGSAAKDVHEYGNLPVPLHIRNAPTKLMKAIGYGKNYDYHHSPTGTKKTGITYLPDKLNGKRYF